MAPEDATALNGVDVYDWRSFDVFELDKLTGAHSLRFLVVRVLEHSGLLSLVDVSRLEKFLGEIERLYSVEQNSYHTSVHAADVVATVATMMKLDAGSFRAFHDWELLSLVIACAGHDVGHKGVTNAYHARLKTEWYRLYAGGGEKSESVNSINELAHADITLSLIRQEQYDFLRNMDASIKSKVLDYIEKMILHTDITWHKDVCDKFASACRKSSSEWTEEDRVQILSGLLHFADVSNPGRPWALCKRWGMLIHDEVLQERESETTSTGDCGTIPTLGDSQIEFIKSTIQPFCQQVSLVSPNFATMIEPHLEKSLAAWAEAE